MASNGNGHSVLSAPQIRAARAILDWSQDELAIKSDLSIATIRKIETGHISPRGKTNDDIRRSFEDAGLEFIEPSGVRHRPEDITVYQGHDGAKAFFDDVYETAREKKCEVILVCSSAQKYVNEILGEYQKTHVERMSLIGKETAFVKCILTEDDGPLWAADYGEYRLMSKNYIDSVPFYVYNDKYAIIVSESDPSPKITVIQSRVVADAFRQQFYSMWEKASPLNKHEKNIMPQHKKKLA